MPKKLTEAYFISTITTTIGSSPRKSATTGISGQPQQPLRRRTLHRSTSSKKGNADTIDCEQAGASQDAIIALSVGVARVVVSMR